MTSEPATPAPLAYENTQFVTSDEARPLRILAEYLEPLKRFRQAGVHDTIVFFGSARMTAEGLMGHYYRDAQTLARMITQWSKSLPSHAHRYVICSGGGGGIMEAANRGASEAGGKTIGLNISLPNEQRANPWITHELAFNFHYFFMRKLWFAHLARGLVAFPGGFGTLDEVTEILTLTQTRKLDRRIPVILYGSEYWNEILNFKALLRHGMISVEDLELFECVDTPEAALSALQAHLEPETIGETPFFAHTQRL
ncbi:MAG TPA: TIGR00730 family Rossman fold protein [Steroidobacteraceae bacterium]|nr:TIGR00730 family Rossman fold protein [Steroidobacteraceae bacterium]